MAGATLLAKSGDRNEHWFGLDPEVLSKTDLGYQTPPKNHVLYPCTDVGVLTFFVLMMIFVLINDFLYKLALLLVVVWRRFWVERVCFWSHWFGSSGVLSEWGINSAGKSISQDRVENQWFKPKLCCVTKRGVEHWIYFLFIFKIKMPSFQYDLRSPNKKIQSFDNLKLKILTFCSQFIVLKERIKRSVVWSVTCWFW